MNDDAAISALFAAYGESFDDADAERMASLFTYPLTIWQFGKGHVFADDEELQENAEALIDAFDEAGITLTTPVLGSCKTEGDAGFARVSWQQFDGNGEPVHSFTCQYFLLRQEGEWYIASINNEEDE